jgi:ABC-type nitrate/sulfonate/bicarbonate transport system permease component
VDRYVADDLKNRCPWQAGFRLNGWPWLLPALLLLLWYIAARERWMPEQILPAPAVVADTALSLLSGDLLAQWGFSLQHLALGCCWAPLLVRCSGRCLAWYRPPRSG